MSAPSTRVIRPCTVVTGSASEVPCESTGFVAWAVARSASRATPHIGTHILTRLRIVIPRQTVDNPSQVANERSSTCM